MKTFTVLLLVVAIASVPILGKKKEKGTVQKIIYVQAPSQGQQQAQIVPKQLSQYDQCKQECRTKRDAQTRQEYVEELKRELQEAEKAVTAREEDGKAFATDNGSEFDANGVKVSRYDHLKMAAATLGETGNQLKQAVTGTEHK